jgi:hypothetical protein
MASLIIIRPPEDIIHKQIYANAVYYCPVPSRLINTMHHLATLTNWLCWQGNAIGRSNVFQPLSRRAHVCIELCSNYLWIVLYYWKYILYRFSVILCGNVCRYLLSTFLILSTHLVILQKQGPQLPLSYIKPTSSLFLAARFPLPLSYI